MPWRNTLAREQQERKHLQLWRSRHQVGSAQSIEINRQGKTYLNFCSNDYLGLSTHPDLVKAMSEAVTLWGAGSGASHLVCGHQSPHQLLEEELAEFVGAEKAILFSTGYMANLAVPQSFLSRGDLLIQDKLNHASLIDGAKVCLAELRRYRHSDIQQLADILAKAESTHSNQHQHSNQRRILISTDAVFSMDGDIAKLDELDRLAQQHGAVLFIDDAHGLGILGEHGSGSFSQFGFAPNGHRLMLGTLGKALGSFGAFVAGDAIYIDQLVQHARTYIYTTALPAPVAEATRAALKAIRTEPERRQRLADYIEYFRHHAGALGLSLMPSTTPIQPILLGDERSAVKASQILEDEGIWVSAIRPPTVPSGSARLRITLCSEHSQQHLDKLIRALSQVKEQLL